MKIYKAVAAVTASALLLAGCSSPAAEEQQEIVNSLGPIQDGSVGETYDYQEGVEYTLNSLETSTKCPGDDRWTGNPKDYEGTERRLLNVDMTVTTDEYQRVLFDHAAILYPGEIIDRAYVSFQCEPLEGAVDFGEVIDVDETQRVTVSFIIDGSAVAFLFGGRAFEIEGSQ